MSAKAMSQARKMSPVPTSSRTSPLLHRPCLLRDSAASRRRATSHQTWMGFRVGARLAREEVGAVSKHFQTRTAAFAGKVDPHPARSNLFCERSLHRKNRLPKIEHQAIGPGENGDRMDQVQDLGVIQPLFAQGVNVAGVQ